MNTHGQVIMSSMLTALRQNDPSFTEDMEKKIHAIYEGSADAGGSSPERVLSRKEAAYLIHASVDTVDLYCRKGLLKKIHPSNASRAIGISAKSVSDFTEISLKRLFDALNNYYRNDAA